jgi:transcriptional regulator with XRE-family HTH domain
MVFRPLDYTLWDDKLQRDRLGVMNTRELVAWNVRRLRVARNISAEMLAMDSGVDRAYVSRIERALANPTIDVLERIASVLEVEMAELFRVPEQDEIPPNTLPGGRRTKR